MDDYNEKSINAVNEAVKFYDAVDFASLHSHQGSPVGEAFVQAHNAIQTCYERIGAAAVWETQKKTTLKDADAKDEERLKNYIAKLQPQVGTVQEKLVDVTVDVHEGSASGSVIKNFTVRVPRGTRLGAIHWSACHTHLHSDEQQVAERVHAVSCFYMGTTRYSMKCVVEDLGGDLDEYKLQIIL
ncbi:hypothetical protein OF83DRAFT_1180714 [Amylostereum chailletii]|nr:hypothetical protein OF83DRAFT_1180714 [Amylostereum chailletii]